MGKFVITKRLNGEYRYNLIADNGEIILSGEGYKSKQGALKGVASVMNHSIADDSYHRKRSDNGKYYFNLVALNGEVIGTSEMYKSQAGRAKGVASVKKNARNASIDSLAFLLD